jgi:hypothetical protein
MDQATHRRILALIEAHFPHRRYDHIGGIPLTPDANPRVVPLQQAALLAYLEWWPTMLTYTEAWQRFNLHEIDDATLDAAERAMKAKSQACLPLRRAYEEVKTDPTRKTQTAAQQALPAVPALRCPFCTPVDNRHAPGCVRARRSYAIGGER